MLSQHRGPFLGLLIFTLAASAAAQSNRDVNPVLVPPFGHSLGVSTVAFGADGNLMASWAHDGVIRLWDPTGGWYLRGIPWSSRTDVQLLFSPRADWIVAGYEGIAAIWDTQSGTLVRELKDTEGSGDLKVPGPLAISDDGRRLAMAGGVSQMSGQILVWDTSVWKVTQRLSAGPGLGHLLQFVKGTHRLVSVWSDTGQSTVTLWDADRGEQIRVKNMNEATSAALSPSGEYLVLGSWRDLVTVLDFRTNETVISLAGPDHASNAAIYHIAISLDSHFLAASDANSLTIWQLPDGHLVRQSDEPVSTLVFSRQGNLIVGTDTGDIELQNNQTGEVVFRYTKAGDEIRKIVIDPEGSHLAGVSIVSPKGRLWNLKTGGEVGELRANGSSGLTDIQFSQNGKYMAVAVANQTIQLIDRAEASVAHVFRTNNTAYSLAFTPDSRMLVLAGRYALSTRIWSLGSFELVKEFQHSEDAIGMSVAMNGVGDLMAQSDGHNVVVRSTKSWEPVITLGTQYGGIYSIDAVAFNPTGSRLVATALTKISVWDTRDWSVREFNNRQRSFNNCIAFSHDGSLFAVGHQDGTISIWSAAEDFKESYVVAAHDGSVTSIIFGPDDHWIMSGGTDGLVTVTRTTDGGKLATLLSLGTLGDWLVATPEGLIDGTPPAWAKVLWRFNNATTDVSPVEVAFRDYYEPRLLPRLLDCNKAADIDPEACAKEFPNVRPLGDLNRVQPGVKIVEVKREQQADLAEVTVVVSPASGQFQREGKPVTVKTDVYDLRLFRAGQLVGQEPELSPEAEASLKNGVVLTPEELKAWQAARRVKAVAGRVELDAKSGKLTRTFTVRLPHGEAGKEIEFTAYAFNEDRVKSETARISYTVPADVGPVKRRAYVVAMGVNAYENPGWDLRFAASDATRLQQALVQRLDKKQYEVVPVMLISDCKTAGCPKEHQEIGEYHATKASFHAVLELLAGHELSAELKQSLPPGTERIRKAEPDDLVVLSVSSHGYTSKEGMFYMIPSDGGQTEGLRLTPELLKELQQKWISSDELSAWLREVDAGEMVMVVDTCHSAATVEEPGFKPGPMGSRGLGQLAYDKGMKILAASQANDVALESEKLKQGLLTYALVHDGLEARQAVKPGTKEITLDSWLKYGSERVPKLYEEVLHNNVQTFADAPRDVTIDEQLSAGTSTLKKPNAFQQPSLFNFQKHASSTILLSFN